MIIKKFGYQVFSPLWMKSKQASSQETYSLMFIHLASDHGYNCF